MTKTSIPGGIKLRSSKLKLEDYQAIVSLVAYLRLGNPSLTTPDYVRFAVIQTTNLLLKEIAAAEEKKIKEKEAASDKVPETESTKEVTSV